MLNRLKGQKHLKSTILLSSLATVFTVAALTEQQEDILNASAACVCESDSNQYNTALPASHPSNRCATKDDLSWKTWLTGNNSSTQFHFVDLLELLYGHNDQPIEDINPANSNT